MTPFLKSLRRCLALLLQLVASPRRDGRRLVGFLLLLGAIPLVVAVQLLHWLAFLLDEIFYRGYRDVPVREPLFVLGPPRTGTTHLHHVLSADPNTTTFRTWECLFGLSVSSRKLLLALGRVDRALGRPAGRLGSWLGRRLTGSMEDIHPVGLDDPEEDFLCLLPLAACFLLVVPFPRAAWLWDIARFGLVPAMHPEAPVCFRGRQALFVQERVVLRHGAGFAHRVPGRSHTVYEP